MGAANEGEVKGRTVGERRASDIACRGLTRWGQKQTKYAGVHGAGVAESTVN